MPSGPNQRALASAYSSEADILYSINDLVGADENYRKAVSLAEAAVRKLPPDLDTRRQLAGTLRNWGDLAGAEGISNMGKPEEALARYRRSLNIVNGLVQKYPGSPLAKRDLYESLQALADAETTAGHHAAAEEQARGALAMIREISAADPETRATRLASPTCPPAWRRFWRTMAMRRKLCRWSWRPSPSWKRK